MTSSLVGSEMCIRDRHWEAHRGEAGRGGPRKITGQGTAFKILASVRQPICLLYTSDAADDM
eukprot:6778049-Prorocentrum_lima.AAC.1